MNKTFPTLYKRDSNKRIQEWTIQTKGDGYFVVEGLREGKKTTTALHTCEPKNPGKKNETSADEQALKEAEAKHAHKLAHGYSLSIDDVDDTGYQEPMLAKQFEDYKDKIVYPVWVDPKLNGVRLNIRDGVGKSRKGKLFNTIPHILNELEELFRWYPNLFLDGEAYNDELKNHLNRLVEVVSVAYKPKDVTPELLTESEKIVQFHVYDGFGFPGITQETPFIQRRAALKELLKDIKYVKVLNYVTCNNEAEVNKLLAASRIEQREGVIIRWSDSPYEFKRSKYLLKLKNFVTEEFIVEDVQPGNGSWANCAKRIVLKLHKPVIGRDGEKQTTFASNIEGDQEFLGTMLAKKEQYIGCKATVRYQEKSEFGVPLIPYIEVIDRNYE